MNRLLVIEDDPNTLSGLSELLTEEGYIVYGVFNGNEALKIITEKTIDIILCDYTLPDMNGLEFCSILKKKYPGILLFLITAFYDKIIFNSAKNIGVVDIFIKPIIIDDFLKKLASHSNK